MQNMTQQEFKNTAKKLHSFISGKNDITLSQTQQFLSQSLFHKPYEEIKETILTGKINFNAFLFNDTYFILKKSSFKKINNCSKNDLIKKLKNEKIKFDILSIVDIPKMPDLNFKEKNDDVLYVKDMANKMGYFSKNNIFDDWNLSNHLFITLLNNNGVVYSGKHYSNEKLSGDWLDRFEDEGLDTLCAIIEDDGLSEYFSFLELTKATYNKFDQAWHIPYDKGIAVINFVI